MSRPERLVPAVLPVSATALDQLARCPRLYRNAQLLRLPASDPTGAVDFGNFVHAVLQHLHRTGPCRDAEHVDDVLAGFGLEPDDAVAQAVARHRRRCPQDSARGRHEVEWSRFHKRPPPLFMAVGRLDAVWERPGVLEIRDYKTGRVATENLAEDPRARLQAWLLARVAEDKGLRLRIRYEHLADEVDDDPDPFEPEPDDLVAIEEDLCAFAARVQAEAAMPDGFAGVHDAAVCGWCPYRSVCPDSASPAVPTWPEPPEADPDEVGIEAG